MWNFLKKLFSPRSNEIILLYRNVDKLQEEVYTLRKKAQFYEVSFQNLHTALTAASSGQALLGKQIHDLEKAMEILLMHFDEMYRCTNSANAIDDDFLN